MGGYASFVSACLPFSQRAFSFVAVPFEKYPPRNKEDRADADQVPDSIASTAQLGLTWLEIQHKLLTFQYSLIYKIKHENEKK